MVYPFGIYQAVLEKLKRSWFFIFLRSYAIICLVLRGTTYEGLNVKLDVGLYRLDQQVACQRIDKSE